MNHLQLCRDCRGEYPATSLGDDGRCHACATNRATLPRIAWTSRDGYYRIVEALDEDEGRRYQVVEQLGPEDAMGVRSWRRATFEARGYNEHVPLDWEGFLPARYALELANAAARS